MNDFTVTGGRINNRSTACHDSYMAAYNDDITGRRLEKLLILVYLPAFLAGGMSCSSDARRPGLKHHYTKPEQSKEFGPLEPHTYGQPSLELATARSAHSRRQFAPPVFRNSSAAGASLLAAVTGIIFTVILLLFYWYSSSGGPVLSSHLRRSALPWS